MRRLILSKSEDLSAHSGRYGAALKQAYRGIDHVIRSDIKEFEAAMLNAFPDEA
nr:hypothetical protein [uncultured Hyphomonas sp.]